MADQKLSHDAPTPNNSPLPDQGQQVDDYIEADSKEEIDLKDLPDPMADQKLSHDASTPDDDHHNSLLPDQEELVDDYIEEDSKEGIDLKDLPDPMADQKLSHDALTPDDDHHNSPLPGQEGLVDDYIEEDSEEESDPDSEEERDPSSEDESDPSDLSEDIEVNLSELRKNFECPICLGIIRKTRVVMECLHRFCRVCIDKAIRMGKNECPACRTHCASRRSLRDDTNFDALIAALFPDIDNYEAEELGFDEEEKAHNMQIQASFSETKHRQSEAVGRKRKPAKATDSVSVRRQANDCSIRGRRNQRATEFQGSDSKDDNNGHDGSQDSSSTDKPTPEVELKQYKRRSEGNKPEITREMVGGAAGLVGSPEMQGWGGGGMRSDARHDMSDGNGKNIDVKSEMQAEAIKIERE